MSDHLESQVNEIEQDRTMSLVRWDADTDRIKSVTAVNYAYAAASSAKAELLSARARLRSALVLAVLTSIVIGITAAVHFL